MTWSGQVPCHPVESAGVVYVEVPKAGCTSIKWALSAFKGGPPPDGTDIHGWFGYTHARHVGELHQWLDTRWRDLFRFTVIRDPVARFVSFYYGLSSWERGCYGDINRYILTRFEVDEWRSDIHAIPQTMLVGRDLGRFDFVGHTEVMDEVAARLSSVTSTQVEIGHENRSAVERVDLSAEAIARLQEIYRADLEVMGG